MEQKHPGYKHTRKPRLAAARAPTHLRGTLFWKSVPFFLLLFYVPERVLFFFFHDVSKFKLRVIVHRRNTVRERRVWVLRMSILVPWTDAIPVWPRDGWWSAVVGDEKVVIVVVRSIKKKPVVM